MSRPGNRIPVKSLGLIRSSCLPCVNNSLDADAAAIVRATHRGGTLLQLVDRVSRKGAPMRPSRAAEVVAEQVQAGHLRVKVFGAETYYSRLKAGSRALKAWQQGGLE